MNIIQEQETDQQDYTHYISFDDSEIYYNYFKIPADFEKAFIHGQAYTVQKQYIKHSQQCLCCYYHKDHIKYTFFEGQKYYHHHSSLGEYFELIKYCIYQLLIIGILLVPYCTMIHSNGNQCEKTIDCNINTNKIYSIWNLIPKYHSLDNQNYSYIVHFTFLILQLVHFRFFTHPKIIKKLQTAAIFRYFEETCLYFPKTIKQDIVEYMKSKQPNLYEQIVFDKKKYEDVLYEELKVQYSKIYDKDNKQKMRMLMKLLQNNTLLDECIIGKIVLMNRLALFERELNMMCQIYNQQVQKYEYQDIQKGVIKAQWFIVYNLIFSYYLPRVLIMLTMFFRLKLITGYFNEEDFQITQRIIKGLFGIIQILILKLSDYICQNGSSMVHQTFQLFVFIDIALSGHFTEWVSCFNPFNYYTEVEASRWMLQKEGLVDNQITISELNIFIPVLASIFDYQYLWKLIKYKIEKRNNLINVTQIEANKLFEKREFKIQQKRFTIYKIYCLCLSTALFYPFIILSSIISLLLMYLVDKYLFIKQSIPISVEKIQEYLQCYFLFGLNLILSNLIISYQMISVPNVRDNILLICCLCLQFYLYFESIKIYLSNSLVKSQPKQSQMIKFLQQFNLVDQRNGTLYLHNNVIYDIFVNLKKKLNQLSKQKKRSIIIEDHYQLG